MALVALPAECAFVHVILAVATGTRHRQNRLAGHRHAVTAIAIQPAMPALQLETGARVVVVVPQAPAACVMAAFALRAQPAFVHVILFMARQTFGFGVLVLRRDVALPALHHQVSAQQGKAGAAMIERGSFPVLRAVALLALLAQGAFVHIAFLMTGKTGDRRVLVFPVFVAIVALHFAVLAQQAKLRLAMIEPVFLPVARIMAVAALLAQGAFVLVILLVTGDTGHGCIPEYRTLVAGLALDVVMLAK